MAFRQSHQGYERHNIFHDRNYTIYIVDSVGELNNHNLVQKLLNPKTCVDVDSDKGIRINFLYNGNSALKVYLGDRKRFLENVDIDNSLFLRRFNQIINKFRNANNILNIDTNNPVYVSARLKYPLFDYYLTASYVLKDFDECRIERIFRTV